MTDVMGPGAPACGGLLRHFLRTTRPLSTWPATHVGEVTE